MSNKPDVGGKVIDLMEALKEALAKRKVCSVCKNVRPEFCSRCMGAGWEAEP